MQQIKNNVTYQSNVAM
jgi:hypothetical protein